MNKSQFKNYLLEQEKLLTQLIELEIKTYGSNELARKICKKQNYFSVRMGLIKKEKNLHKKVKKLLEVAGSIWFSEKTIKAKIKPPVNFA